MSVIIPTFGEPTFLREAIESVLTERRIEIEVLIVSDNAAGGRAEKAVVEITKSFDDTRVRLILLGENRGGGYARNVGISEATGEHIAFLDDDDEFLPGRLVECTLLIGRDNSFGGFPVGGVYTGCKILNAGGRSREFLEARSGRFLVATLACSFPFYSGSNLFVKRKVFDTIGMFDTAFSRHQDYEFLVRFFEEYSLLGLSKPLLLKRNMNRNLPDVNHMRAVKSQYLSKFSRILSSLNRWDRNYVVNANELELLELALRGKGSVDLYQTWRALKFVDYRLPLLLFRVVIIAVLSRYERYKL